MAEGGDQQRKASYKEDESVEGVGKSGSEVSGDLTPSVTRAFDTGVHGRSILWMDILPSDHTILLSMDNETGQLHLYSASKNLVSQIDLPVVHSAAMLSDHQVIVPLLGTQQLQMIYIDDDKLTKGSVIDTDVEPILILKYSDSSVLVLAEDEDEGMCFAILDLTGKVQKHIELDINPAPPAFMRMNHERSVVYIVWGERGGCFGFNLKGDQLFHYTHSGYGLYMGLAIDARGDIYCSVVEDDGITFVVKLSPAGHVLKQIDIRNVYPLQCFGNTLFLGGYFKDLKEDVVISSIGI